MIYHVDFIGYADRGSAVLVDASFSCKPYYFLVQNMQWLALRGMLKLGLFIQASAGKMRVNYRE